jgi:hypothetical protein
VKKYTAVISTLILIFILNACTYTGELVYVKGDNQVYHKGNCPFVKKAGQDDILLIGQNLKSTVRAHLRPCKTCKPLDNALYIPIVIEEIEEEISKLAHKYRTTPERWMAEGHGIEEMTNRPIWAAPAAPLPSWYTPPKPLTVKDTIRMDMGRLVNEINQIYKAYRIDETVTIEDYLNL